MVNWSKTSAGTANSPHAIGWAWWTTKKVISSNYVTGPYTNPASQPYKCTAPAAWDALNTVAKWNAATAAAAKDGLMAMADALKTPSAVCQRQDAIITALGGTP
jgi:hypothetical protein